MPKKTQESSHFGPNWPTQPRDFVRPVKWATLNCESDDDDFFFLRMAGGGQQNLMSGQKTSSHPIMHSTRSDFDQ